MPNQQTTDNVVFRLTVRATDNDAPANALTYELGPGAPAGTTLDPVTGELTWSVGAEIAQRTRTIRCDRPGSEPSAKPQ